MRKVKYRVPGILLSMMTALLGVAVTVLLYLWAKDFLDVAFTEIDDNGVIHEWESTSSGLNSFILGVCAFGSVYILPGISGFIASLVFKRCPMIVHYVIGTLALFVGTLLHTTILHLFIWYYFFVEYGTLKYNFDGWPWNCARRLEGSLNGENIGDICETSQNALALFKAAGCVALVAWLFLLSDLLYRGFTFHNIDKSDEPSATVDEAKETKTTLSTLQKGTALSKKESHQIVTVVGQGDTGDSKFETAFTADAYTAPENVNIQEKGYCTPPAYVISLKY